MENLFVFVVAPILVNSSEPSALTVLTVVVLPLPSALTVDSVTATD
jgi:hypothetical protein